MKKLSQEYYKACLLGGAIGDALGAPIEFLTINEIRERHGENGVEDYVEFPDPTGEFTDDTQMTLFTAEGLIRAFHRSSIRGIPADVVEITYLSYLRWLHTQHRISLSKLFTTAIDASQAGWLLEQKGLYKVRYPGNTCLGALTGDSMGTIETPINNSKGCGTIMRVAPIGLMWPGENETSFLKACELSAITHGHPTGYLSAGVFASIISDLAIGTGLEKSIKNSINILKRWKSHEETLKAVEKALSLYQESKNLKGKPLTESIQKLGEGWIAEEALSISLYASLLFKDDYKNGVLFSINHSGDSDSTGSITGNIIGLINGIDAIPRRWIENLKDNELVTQVAEDLHIQLKGNQDEPDDKWWEKYPGC